MRRAPPLPKELWDHIPPPVQAALWMAIESYEQRTMAWKADVAALKERLK